MQNSNDEHLRPAHLFAVMDLPLHAIAEHYGLQLTLVERILSGFLSDNYSLTDGTQKFFFKKHRHTKRDWVEGASLAEQFFAQGGVPVILPIVDKRGAYFFEHEGSFYSLYPYVDGRHIERGLLSEQASVSTGEVLGRLHKRGAQSTLPVKETFNPWDKEKFLRIEAAVDKILSEKQELSEFDELTRKSLQLKKHCVLGGSPTFEDLGLKNDHLIHGDYFCNNVFFDEGDRVSYVFDFEKAQYAPGPYELFRGLFVNYFSIPTEENLRLAKVYVDSYLSEYPQPKDVLRSSLTAAYLKQIHSIWIEEGHYLKGSTRMDPLLSSQHTLNEYYVSNRERIEKYLLA